MTTSPDQRNLDCLVPNPCAFYSVPHFSLNLRDSAFAGAICFLIFGRSLFLTLLSKAKSLLKSRVAGRRGVRVSFAIGEGPFAAQLQSNVPTPASTTRASDK